MYIRMCIKPFFDDRQKRLLNFLIPSRSVVPCCNGEPKLIRCQEEGREKKERTKKWWGEEGQKKLEGTRPNEIKDLAVVSGIWERKLR